MRTHKMNRLLAPLAIVLAVIPLASVAVAGGSPDPRIIPNVALPHGSSYGEWTIEWSKWLVRGTMAEAPYFDTTGERCAFGQSGKVFFLTGSASGTLDCVVPQGVMIFTPLDWGFWWNPEDAWCSDDPAVCEAGATAIIDQVDILEVAIDGVPVANPWQYRAASGAFTFDIAAGSWPTEVGYPAGPRYPAVTEGHWLMLAPLPAGQHTIHWVWGSTAWGGVMIDETYHLTVTGAHRSSSPKQFQVQD